MLLGRKTVLSGKLKINILDISGLKQILVKAVPSIKYNYVCKYVVDVCIKQD